MPFKEHPIFLPPDSSDAKIWRYIDLAKFLSLLDGSSLYFVRLDHLSEFDPFEGYYTDLNLKADDIKFEDLPEEWKESSGIKEKRVFEIIRASQKNAREIVKYLRSAIFVNSWHIKEYESAAMWKIYLRNDEGIAIQSTYQRLIDSMANYDKFEIIVGRINYIDYEKDAIPMGNLLSPFMHKRKNFEFEDELRALIWPPQPGENFMNDPDKNEYKDVPGLYVPVDLNRLIDKIYVAPSAPVWIKDLVDSVSVKYGLDKEVVQSNLASKPPY